MRRAGFCTLFVIVSSALNIGCTSDTTTLPALFAPTVRLAGDSVLTVTGKITLSAQGTDSTGKLVNAQIYWRSSAPSIADVNGAGVVTGRAAGTAVITASFGLASATITVTVRDERPTVSLAVGESFAGRIVTGIAMERFSVSAAAGDTLDLLVRLDSADASLFGAHLQSTGADWLKLSVRTSHGIALYGAVVPSSTGAFAMEAIGDMICGGRHCVPPSGPYTVRVRRSAPIFAVPNYYNGGSVSVPEGALGRDSLWAQNPGLGTVTVRATSSVPWLRPEAATMALPGPTSGGTGPGVATQIRSTVDARGLPQGVHNGSIDLDGSTGEWSNLRPFGHHLRSVQLRVTDSSARLVPATARLRNLAAAPDGRVYGVASDSILAVDPVSGATSLVARLAFSPSEIAVGSDGAVYVRRSSIDSGGVFRINGSSLEQVLIFGRCGGSFVVLPNGTVYGFCGADLFRRVLGGAQERVTTLWSNNFPATIVHRPADDALYLTHSGEVRRYDLATGSVTLVGTVTDHWTFSLYGVDAQGRLVGAVPYQNLVRVHDTNAAVLDQRTLPDYVSGLAIVGNTIVVTNGTRLWRLPVR